MSFSRCNCCRAVQCDNDDIELGKIGIPEGWFRALLRGEAGKLSIELEIILCPQCIEKIPGGFKTWSQFSAYFDTE